MIIMVKIFFGCSMRGGYVAVRIQELESFPKIIEELGYELASRHQTQRGIIEEENKLVKTSIHDRDYEWLTGSDVGVFEISNPSLGVGGEISDMVHLHKPVLCLFKKGLENKVSAYIQGKMGSKYVKTIFEIYTYSDLSDVKGKIRQFVEAIS
jgi:2'-deoxynucleoside 5'-phosphate N-hydrolase